MPARKQIAPTRVCPQCGESFDLYRYFNKNTGHSLGFRGGKYCSKHCSYESYRVGWSVEKSGYIDHAIAVLTEQGIFIPENNSTWVNGLLSL